MDPISYKWYFLVHLGADDQRTLLHQSDPQDPGLEPQTSQDTRPDACKLKFMICYQTVFIPLDPCGMTPNLRAFIFEAT